MNQIRVNTQNQQYKDTTSNKGNLGIGTPYTTDAQTTGYIIVDSSVLSAKIDKLQEFRNGWENEVIALIPDVGQTPLTQLDYDIRNALRDILFPLELGIPEDVAGDNLYTFFPYVFNTTARSTFRLQTTEVLDKWIKLFDDIMKITSGLSELVTISDTSITWQSVSVQHQCGRVTISNIVPTVLVSDALYSASKALVDFKTIQFFDENREYKTIVNFGQDRQYLAEAWRTVPSDSSSIQVKLLSPLSEGIQLYDQSYIAEEFAKSVVDTITIELPPLVDDTRYLRPANMDVGKFTVDKQSIKNVTLGTLELLSGSSGNIADNVVSYDDRVFNRWFTADYNASELNIDFFDYNNFVFFGSAKTRLSAFANKLQKLQSYGDIKVSSLSSTDSERKLAQEVEYIKRNFDPYEQYLYFASQSNAYTASAYYVDGGVEYNATGSWPKDANMIPLAYTSSSVQSWYQTQVDIAERFDEFNPNYLVKHLPGHIQEDENSADFITFIQMFGHVMDNIKVYIDQFINIYSTSPDPFKELTMDQAYEVAKSFGMDLPNAFSLEELQTFIASLYDGQGARSFVAETWKRFIHSSTYIRKLKGSRTGVDAVINTYGLNSPLVQLKESTYAVDGNYMKSDELVYGLHFTGSVSSSVRIPFVSSSYTASTVQIRFIPELRKSSSLFTTNGTWGVELIPHPSSSTTAYFNTQSLRIGTTYFTLNTPTKEYGKIHVVSGSNKVVIASSSYFPLFSDTYTHIMLRSQSQDITFIQTDGDQILFQQSASLSLGSLWNTTYLYLGGTGSLRLNNFDGIIDDVRVWGEETTTDNFTKQAYDPGSYYGTNYSSSYNSLYVDLSFSQPYAAITQSATNESPFSNVANLSYIPATGLTTASYVRILRTIKQFTPVAGTSIFSNKKVSVAPPPVFTELSVDSNGVQTLKVNSSIKPVEDKVFVGGLEYVQFAVSPTDFVNQTIMRSMGDVDTNYLIGSPSKYTNERYTELDKVFDFFLKNYNESINVNEYIRFFKNVIKAPTEYMQSYVPARSKLVDGIVIESPFLSRRRERLQKSIKVDGTNTRTFDNFVSGSGSVDVGAYDFLLHYPKEPQQDTSTITTPTPPMQQFGIGLVTSSFFSNNSNVGYVETKIDSTNVGPVSSTELSKVPPSKQFTQKIGIYYVSSSLADNNSSVGFVEGEIQAVQSTVTQSGYPRDPYLGVTYQNSTTYRVLSEYNTQVPYYAIEPITDFMDVGATTYFHKNDGVYKLRKTTVDQTQYKKKDFYLVKLDIPIGEIESDASREFARINLFPTSSLVDVPGRFTVKISSKVYTVGSQYLGVLNSPNIFSVYRIVGASGLRLRVYRNRNDQTNDLARSFATIPLPTDGVLFDGLLNGDSEVFPYTLVQTDSSVLYFTVDNVGTVDITSDITMYAFSYEPTNNTPSGYLPRHYKFTRTKNVALTRRNYLGCRIVHCPEGCPPDVDTLDSEYTKVNPIREEFTPTTSTTSTTGTGPGKPKTKYK